MSDLILEHIANSENGTLQIGAAGRLTIENVAELLGLLQEQLGQHDNTRLDLSALDEIDLTGVQLICSACRTSLEAGQRFNLTGDMPTVVQTAINTLGLQQQATCKHNADLPCIWCGGLN